METEQSNRNSRKDEIEPLALAKIVWTQRRKIIFIVSFFLGVGLLIAVLSPKEFTASSTFVPQTGDSNRPPGSFGGLATLAGINLGNMGGGSEIPLSLYPKIVSSVTFRKALLDVQFHVEGKESPISYREYYEEIYSPGILGLVKKYTLGIPGIIIKSLKGASEVSEVQSKEGLIRVSPEEFEHFKRLDNQLSISPNEKEGFVTLSFALPEPIMAAQMAQFAQELLQKEIISFKISNAREQLKFTEERFEEKKAEFQQIQGKLSNFRDRNQNIASATMQNQLQRLEAEYNFAFSIYTDMAKQLEQARLQVAKDTPIFSVIQPTTIPSEKSAPNRPLILVIFTMLGVILGLSYVFGSEFLKVVKEQWNQRDSII